MTLVDMFKLNFLFVTVFLSSKFDFFAFFEYLYMCSSFRRKCLLSLNT